MRNVVDGVVEKIGTQFMFIDFFAKIVPFYVEKCGAVGRALCIPHNLDYGYTSTLRICNTYYFSTATMFTRTHLHVSLYLRSLPYFLAVVADIELGRLVLMSLIAPFRHIHPVGLQRAID
jgi:hypothetical protein